MCACVCVFQAAARAKQSTATITKALTAEEAEVVKAKAAAAKAADDLPHGGVTLLQEAAMGCPGRDYKCRTREYQAARDKYNKLADEQVGIQ